MPVFSQTAEYALRAVVCLAQNEPQSLTTQQIAALTQVPIGYLSKVLQQLARGKLLASQRGIGGGFTLRKPPKSITIHDIMQIVDPMQRITTCPLGLKSHGKQLCPLHRKMDDAMAVIEKAFSETTIDELLKDPNKSTPLCEVKVKGAAVSRR